MKAQSKTIVITVLVTVAILFAAFFLLMPVFGPRFMHPIMSQYMHGNSDPITSNKLDTDTEKLTENGAYHVSFKSDLDPITINQIHTWVLHIESADGQPVEGATILVDGGMPEHGHGLPTAPQVTQDLGNGDYLVEGLKFQMGGWWEVKFNITANGNTDNVTFNIMLGG
jgi:hypothetical protein